MINKKDHSYKVNFAKLIFFTLVLFGGVAFLFFAPRVSLPLVFSYLTFLIVGPMPQLLRRVGLSKTIANLTVAGFLAVLIIWPSIKIIPWFAIEIQKIQEYVPKIEHFITHQYHVVTEKVYKRTGFELGDKYLIDILDYGQKTVRFMVLKIPNLLANMLEWIILVPLFVFFLIKERREFVNRFIKIVPNPICERFYLIAYQFNKKLGDYILAKFLEAFIVGIIIYFGLLFAGIKFSFLLGLLAGVTNIIPYVGPLLGFLPAVVICLIEYGPGPQLIWVTSLFGIANIIDMVVVFPILVSKVVDLHPILVILSVILGSQFFGVWGMVISIPLASVVKLALEEIYRALYPAQSKHFSSS